MAIEARRACGHRKVGGLYLVSNGSAIACDRLPYPLIVCPCCSAGFKQSRGWTWVDVSLLVGGIHRGCEDEFPCPLCMATPNLGRAGMLWIGERFYKTPADFNREADRLGISRRIGAVPRGFRPGETWVLLAHPKTTCARCVGAGLKDFERCTACEGTGKAPGIFRLFRPERVEKIITESQSKDEVFMFGLGPHLTPVIVPDNDRDHQGTVYDDDSDEEPPMFGQAAAPEDQP